MPKVRASEGKLGFGNDLIDNTPALERLRGVTSPEHSDFLRARDAGALGESLSPPEQRQQTNRDLNLRKESGIRGYDHVAGQCKLEAAAKCATINRGHGWHRHILQLSKQGLEPGLTGMNRRAGTPFPHLSAGAEMPHGAA